MVRKLQKLLSDVNAIITLNCSSKRNDVKYHGERIQEEAQVCNNTFLKVYPWFGS